MQRLGSAAFAIIAGTFSAGSNTGAATAPGGQEASCYLAGHLDTDRVRADIEHSFRTDRVWYEVLISRLLWELDRGRFNGSSNPVVVECARAPERTNDEMATD